jgi:uncharacterized membrane protein
MSPQTWIISIVLTVMTILFVTIAAMNKALGAHSIVPLIFWIFSIFLLSYDTECLVGGNCHIWSWIRTILYSIMPTIIIIILLLSMTSNNKNKQNDQKTD